MRTFVSTSCNRVAQGTDILDGGDDEPLVAMPAHNSVALVCGRKLVATLHGHNDRVSVVRFMRLRSSPVSGLLVSASADASLKLWVAQTNAKYSWRCAATLSGHSAPVNAVAVLETSHNSALIASAATDASVRIWECVIAQDNTVSATCVQTIKTGPRYALTAALAFLPNTRIPILFLGGCDNHLSVHLRTGEGNTFIKMLALQGHTDWIRGLDVTVFTGSASGGVDVPGWADGDLMVASASQDKYVRLWKVSEITASAAPNSSSIKEEILAGSEVVGTNETSNSDFDDAIEMLEALVGDEGEGGRQLSTKAHIIEVSVDNVKRKYTVMFDALLIGHEDWVHSVAWAPRVRVGNASVQKLELVSASADKSVTVWRPDGQHVWTGHARLGEVGGQNSFGFYGARFGPGNQWILAHGYIGAVQFWKAERDADGQETWHPQTGLSGHHRAVEDLAWNATGDFLVSSSLDQTSRLWGEWKRGGKATSWHEIARPQIHGYDLHCLAFVHRYGFVSGADEKVLRVFEASRTFLEGLEYISGIKESKEVYEQRPVGASVPALGLSNKAILPGAPIDTNAQLIFEPLAPDVVHGPPFEQYLIQHTLWPEVNKLYGHGYELISVAASHDGMTIASSSKAAVAEHAVIRVWSTGTWREVQTPLASHSLTVTGLQFSHDDQYLLSCGRDRMWSLFERDGSDGEFKLIVNNSAHGRIIWGCSWSHDDIYFATASRDKTVKVWARHQVSTSAESSLTIPSHAAATSVAFAPRASPHTYGAYVLAVGHEDGRIALYDVLTEGTVLVARPAAGMGVDAVECPGAAVRRLVWRPKDGQWVLASASEDHSVRIYEVGTA